MPERWLKWRLALGLLLAGALHALSFAPEPMPGWSLSALQILTMAWLVHCVWRAPSALLAARRAWLFALAHFIVGVYWLTISMHTYGHMLLPLAILALSALSAFLALFASLAGWLAHRTANAPLASAPQQPARLISLSLLWAASWTLCEWLRGTLFTGFPWLNTGYAHVDSWFAGWGPISGVYGLTFISAFSAATLACLLEATSRHPSHQPQRAMVGLMAISLALSGWALQSVHWSTDAGAPLRARLVQGNIDQGIKFTPRHIQQTIETHLRLAATPAPANTATPQLVLLPETALAIFQHQLDPAVWEAWRVLAVQQGSTIMMGAALFDRAQGTYTNSVIGIERNTTLEALTTGHTALRYDKHHLVPFGEFVPWGFRWFVDQLSIPLGDFHRGATRQLPFAVGDQRIAPNICYEDVFGEELIAALTPQPETANDQAATILANFSNLGWFGDSWALRQHWQMARMRSIETSRPTLRATNTGMTGAIDQRGKTIARLLPFQPAILDVEIQGQSGLTPYARWGNYPILLLSVLVLGFGVRQQYAGLVDRKAKASRSTHV